MTQEQRDDFDQKENSVCQVMLWFVLLQGMNLFFKNQLNTEIITWRLLICKLTLTITKILTGGGLP